MLRKRSLTLIEILISMTLFSLLLTSLFFWYRHFTDKKRELERIKSPYLEERYLFQRLQRILPQSQPPFFTDQDSLVFCFDRGIYSDPKLSGRVLAKLYRDSHSHALSLGIWQAPETKEKNPSQTLTLLDGVEELSFEFYSPPDPFQKPVDPQEIGNPRPQPGWQKTWNFDHLPALVKITLKHNDDSRDLYFDLREPIIYPAEKA